MFTKWFDLPAASTAAVSTVAAMATAATTAAAAAATPVAATAAPAARTWSTISTIATTTRRTRTVCAGRIFAVEVRLTFFFFAAFVTALEGHSTGGAVLALRDLRTLDRFAAAFFRSHLRALLFQHGFARQLDAVPVHG